MARELPAQEEVKISITVLPDHLVRTLYPVIMIRHPANFFSILVSRGASIHSRIRLYDQGNHAPPDLCLLPNDFRLVMRQHLPGAK